jgi:hypothetical protein
VSSEKGQWQFGKKVGGARQILSESMLKKGNVGTSGSYSIKGPLGVISLCGPREQISCGGYFGVYQNTYN